MRFMAFQLLLVGTAVALAADELDTEGLPPLELVLQELQLQRFEERFYEIGVSETQYLLNLKSMDYRIMEREWGLQAEDALHLQEKIESLRKIKLIQQEEEDPMLRRRSQLNYGRLYLNNSVQSFEYFLAAFGSPPPIGWRPLKLADPTFGCDNATDPAENTESIVVTQRGHCSFLRKALNAMHANAEAIVIVNSERSLVHMGSGVGFEEGVNDTMLPLKISAISISSSSWDPIIAAIKSGEVIQASIVPLECKAGEAACEPILKEEKVFPSTEIFWGHLSAHPSTNMSKILMQTEFLTSTFGGVLPHGQILEPVLASPNLDGCELQGNLDNKVLVVTRGNCTFGVKALNAQRAGARLLIIVQTNDDALQRVGASGELAETIGVPAILITTAAGDKLHQVLSSCVTLDSSAETSSSCIKLTLQPQRSRDIAEAWSSLAHMLWSDDEVERLSQLKEARLYHHMDGDRKSWIQRQLDKLNHQ